MSSTPDPVQSALRALEWVEDGHTLGLGTGRAASAFVRALGERVADGLRVRGVPTSESTAALARECGIPLVSLEQAGELDLCVDGADEVSPALDVIKGYGGAHVREKIVAASSRQLVILVGEEKLVDKLGQRGKVPVEVLPFGLALCQRQIGELGLEPKRRLGADGEPVCTDNGNWVLDCHTGAIDDPAALECALRGIPGVLGTGLFVGMADAVIVQRAEGVELRRRELAGQGP